MFLGHLHSDDVRLLAHEFGLHNRYVPQVHKARPRGSTGDLSDSLFGWPMVSSEATG